LEFKPTGLKGSFTIEVKPFVDERGFFTRIFCENEFETHGLKKEVVQANQSFTKGIGSIRGLHMQLPPHAETKVIKCISGKVFDVIVDVRRNSPTFLKWFGAELSAKNKLMMYVPEGFAHGFQTLTEEAEIIYFVSQFYHKPSERTIRFDEPRVNIKWPLPLNHISEKDKQANFLEGDFPGCII
jgi:dTDP-4-dehydrorhamnose 3,5-epimerase